MPDQQFVLDESELRLLDWALAQALREAHANAACSYTERQHVQAADRISQLTRFRDRLEPMIEHSELIGTES